MNITTSIVVFFFACIICNAKGEMLKGRSPLDSDHDVHRGLAEHDFLGRVSARHHSNNVLGRTDDPATILDSEECNDFMDDITHVLRRLLGFSDYELINFVCNPIEMESLLEDISYYEHDVETQSDPCMRAFESLLLESSSTIQEAMSSEGNCVTEMENELAAINEVRRDLVQGQRKLPATLGGAILGGMCQMTVYIVGSIWNSDERLKTDINLVGHSPSGIPIYTFKYRDGMKLAGEAPLDTKSVYVGVMAQDLLELVPNAVVKNPTDGYYRVDYSKIDVDFLKIAN